MCGTQANSNGSGDNFLPRHQAGQGAVRQDRHGEGLVLAVAPPQAGNASGSIDVVFGPLDRLAVAVGQAGKLHGRDGEHRRGDVREALVGVAPAAVGVLISAKPLDGTLGQLPAGRCFGIVVRHTGVEAQGAGGRGRRQGRTRQFARPNAVAAPQREQIAACGLIGVEQRAGIDHLLGLLGF